jgi:hypothetical protein
MVPPIMVRGPISFQQAKGSFSNWQLLSICGKRDEHDCFSAIKALIPFSPKKEISPD